MADQTDPDFDDGLDLLVPGIKGRTRILFKIGEELGKESDRGCALVAAAYLENEITDILERFFTQQGAKARADLFDFNGPLGTFSSKIKISVALGLIPQEIQAALDLVRKVRNDFAHLHEPLDFESSRIKQRVQKLLPDLATSGGAAREIFVMKIQSVAATIHLCASNVYQQKMPAYEPVPVRTDVGEQEIEIAARHLMRITSPEITHEEAVEMVRKIREIK